MAISQRLMALGLTSAVALSGGMLVAENEGLVLGTYLDPIGIVTSCYGHTHEALKLGQDFTEAQCLEQLAVDLSHYNARLLALSPPLSQGEHMAYLSFIYNVGIGAFTRSTLRKKLQNDDRIGACKELKRWVYAAGKKLAGLVRRRQSEFVFCTRNLAYVRPI